MWCPGLDPESEKKKIRGSAGEIQIRSEVNNSSSVLIFWFRKLYSEAIRWGGNIKEREWRVDENWWTTWWTILQLFLSIIV